MLVGMGKFSERTDSDEIRDWLAGPGAVWMGGAVVAVVVFGVFVLLFGGV